MVEELRNPARLYLLLWREICLWLPFLLSKGNLPPSDELQQSRLSDACNLQQPVIVKKALSSQIIKLVIIIYQLTFRRYNSL